MEAPPAQADAGPQQQQAHAEDDRAEQKARGAHALRQNGKRDADRDT